MASIDIQHPHSMNPGHARQAVQELADTLADRFDAQCQWNGDGDILSFTRSGMDGHIALLPNGLHLTAQLGFMLSAMKGPIEKEIRRVLDERF